MKKILYKVKFTVSSEIDEHNQITTSTYHPVRRIKKFFFGLFSREVIKMEKLNFTYWVEYRIDEGRYWYCEDKPVLDSINNVYEYESNRHHTKNGEKESIKILKDIVSRAKVERYDVEVLIEYNNSTKLKGMFLD